MSGPSRFLVSIRKPKAVAPSESSGEDEDGIWNATLPSSPLERTSRFESIAKTPSILPDELSTQFEESVRLSQQLTTNLEQLSRNFGASSTVGPILFGTAKPGFGKIRRLSNDIIRPLNDSEETAEGLAKSLCAAVEGQEKIIKYSDIIRKPAKRVQASSSLLRGLPVQNRSDPKISDLLEADEPSMDYDPTYDPREDSIETWRGSIPRFRSSPIHPLDSEPNILGVLLDNQPILAKAAKNQTQKTPSPPGQENKNTLETTSKPKNDTADILSVIEKPRHYTEPLLKDAKLRYLSPASSTLRDSPSATHPHRVLSTAQPEYAQRSSNPDNVSLTNDSQHGEFECLDDPTDEDIFLFHDDDQENCPEDIRQPYLSEEKLRKDDFFSPLRGIDDLPNGPEKQQRFFDKIIVDQWDKLWTDAYNRVRSRTLGVYDPIKEKRLFDKAKGEEEQYDPIQSRQGSLEWSIHQVFECYVAMREVTNEIEGLRTKAQNLKTEVEQNQRMFSSGNYGKYNHGDVMSAHIELKKIELKKEIPDRLYKLQVRKSLLKKAGESHLWDVAKEDYRFNYRGEMLRGILIVRKFFEETGVDVTDDELKEMGYIVRHEHF
ncbi:hypothetical protein ABW20_dc0104936 [Dactylellina cionopaga]|nr:hypothetical protein ABW20_dc0104936 [Dactylellina cionopaga]